MNKQPPTPSDLDALLSTLPADEARRLREVWHLAGSDEPIDFPAPTAVDQAWQRLEPVVASARRRTATARPAQRQPTDRHARPPARMPRRTRRRSGLVLAAILLAGILGVLWWQQPVTRAAAPGEHLVIDLPDGSRVELNSGASLRYDRRFSAERVVHLDGEAFFDVVPGARPFVVHTFNAEVRVLGTRFGVRAWSAGLDRATTVALQAGRVALAPAGQPARAVTMAPGEVRRVVAGDAVRSTPALSVDEATAWRQGDLVFMDQLLGVMLEDVERRFAVDIRVEPSSLLQTRYGVILRQPESAEAVVRDLAGALGLRYEETAAGFALYKEADRP